MIATLTTSPSGVARLPSSDSQADPFNRDGSFLYHVAAYVCGNGHPEPPIGERRIGVGFDRLEA